MIVLPDSMQNKPFTEYETLIVAGCSLGTQLSFSVHQASHFNTAVKEGHVFYNLVCTEENLLYWSEEKEWPITPEEKQKEIRQHAWQQFQNSFSKAEIFLQQAAELCCRAILISLTGRDKKTHSIAALKKTCRRFTATVEEAFPSYTEEEKRLLKILDDAYIAARYEDDFSPALTNLELLLQKVQQLHQSAMPAVKHRLSLPV